MILETIAHVGAPKCGSSALQSYLTHNPMLTNKTGDSIGYGSFGFHGFTPPDKIKKLINYRIRGYECSAEGQAIRGFSDSLKSQIKSAIEKYPTSLIFSCEDWTNTFVSNDSDILIDLLTAGNSRRLKVVMFVRPPVQWINSAWWQWGAWVKNLDFKLWLANAIDNCKWSKYLRKIQKLKNVSDLLVFPLRGDIIPQFFHSINCEVSYSENSTKNQSLPAEIINLFKHSPELRPGPHDSAIDFVALRAILGSSHSYQKSPWILEKSHIEEILDKTYDSNIDILNLMSEEDKCFVLKSPTWWLLEPYEKNISFSSIGASTQHDYINLSADFLKLLNQTMFVLGKHGLLNELNCRLNSCNK
jgi:hypothetical protein